MICFHAEGVKFNPTLTGSNSCLLRYPWVPPTAIEFVPFGDAHGEARAI
jgi:hypothetical protein